MKAEARPPRPIRELLHELAGAPQKDLPSPERTRQLEAVHAAKRKGGLQQKPRSKFLFGKRAPRV